MPEPKNPRPRDAEKTRQVILEAAGIVFAEHGFAGGRVDAIAKVSGYNKSLIGQYFGDKLGLYAEVIRRADRELDGLLTGVYAPLLQNETAAWPADWFRAFLRTMVQTVFDYLLEHPRFVRILTWEMAAGWRTYEQIVSEFQSGQGDIERFRTLSHKAQVAGLLRSGFVPVIQLTMIVQICQSYLAFLPVYRMLVQGEELSSVSALASAREYLVDFIVAGMIDPEGRKPAGS